MNGNFYTHHKLKRLNFLLAFISQLYNFNKHIYYTRLEQIDIRRRMLCDI